MKRPTIVIAGGGTGGHIYPGLAIARAMSDQYEVHFVGARGGLEEKIVPREGFPLHLISIGKMHSSVGLKKRLMTVLGLPRAFSQALKIHRKLRPIAVLGVGGYASAPFLFLSRLLGTRSVIWEPNAHPGLTNRLLSNIVRDALVVFPEAALLLKSKDIKIMGLPVRAEIEDLVEMPLGAITEKRPFRLLVFGGSQGARAINMTIVEAVEKGGDWLHNLEIVHQTGPVDFETIKARYDATEFKGVTVAPYLYDMPKKLQWADFIVCRAGASTVAEIAAAGKAALFIPLPTAADDHQRKNAESLFKAGAAEMFLQKDFTALSFVSFIDSILKNPEKRMAFENQVQKFHKPDSALEIARFLVARIEP